MRTSAQRFGLILVLGCAACLRPEPRELPAGAQAFSLFGEPLFPPPLEPAEQAKREQLLAEARGALEADPASVEAAIGYGRRLGYLGRFREAIAAFSRAIELHPDDPRLYRHRGHRFITLRDFDAAIRDLSHAAGLVQGLSDEVEPDGLPNERGIPLSTRNQEIFYHLALAHYLAGDFERALPCWRECLRFSANPDSVCSATYWLTMTLRRLGRDAEADEAVSTIRADFDIVEYHAYHRLCLMYRGELSLEELLADARAAGTASVDFATVAYGVASARLDRGEREEAMELLREIRASPQWHAFGFIAAEAELARLG